MTAQEFAKSHGTDKDWVDAMSGKDIQPLRAGQLGTYSGFEATVIRHYWNGMYEIRVPGGVICVSGSGFIPA